MRNIKTDQNNFLSISVTLDIEYNFMLNFKILTKI